MSEWTVIKKRQKNVGEQIATLGFLSPIYQYTIENEEGETKTVTAWDNYGLGDKIAEGDFDDEEDEGDE